MALAARGNWSQNRCLDIFFAEFRAEIDPPHRVVNWASVQCQIAAISTNATETEHSMADDNDTVPVTVPRASNVAFRELTFA